MPQLTLYHASPSRSGITLWMLEETGAPYHIELVKLSENEQNKPPYLAINPLGKVPALKADGVIITEVAAICAYLADIFPERGLAPPPGHRSRGPYYRWLFFAAGPVEAAVTNKALKVEVSEEQSRFVGYGSFDAAIDALELALKPGPYICGDQFTAADVYVGSQIGYGMLFGSIEKRPLFEDYFARIQARPAAIRARELDDALMAPAA